LILCFQVKFKPFFVNSIRSAVGFDLNETEQTPLSSANQWQTMLFDTVFLGASEKIAKDCFGDQDNKSAYFIYLFLYFVSDKTT